MQYLFVFFFFVSIGLGHSQKSVFNEFTIEWNGKRMDNTVHNGKVDTLSTALTIYKKGEIINAKGTVEINMTTIYSTDYKPTDYRKKKLDQHLRSADFFDVENHPAATFVIKDIQKDGLFNYTLKGDLTIKGITKEIVTPIKMIDENNNYAIDCRIKVDRTLFGIHYNDESLYKKLKDQVISNTMYITVKIKGTYR